MPTERSSKITTMMLLRMSLSLCFPILQRSIQHSAWWKEEAPVAFAGWMDGQTGWGPGGGRVVAGVGRDRHAHL